MSNSTSNLDLISVSQAQKEVTANDLFNAASPAMLYGRQARTSGGLVWGYYGGAVSISGVPTAIPNGTITLTASVTNYLEADPATGAVSKNTTGFTAGMTPLYAIVAGASTVSSYTDFRTGGGDGGAAGTAAVSAHEEASDPHPQYMTQEEADARYLQTIGAQPFDATVFYPGVPAASAIIDVEFARTVVFPDDFVGSALKSRVAAAGALSIDLQKNGVSIGAVSFSSGATSGTFSTSGAEVTFNSGDYLSLVFPATPDATLANLRGVFAGNR